MNSLFNTVSNYDTWPAVSGASIISNGETVALAVGTYKCSEGTCAGGVDVNSQKMLWLEDLNGVVKCLNEDASCVLDGETSRMLMRVDGTGSGTLVLRALSFFKGQARNGGGGYFDNSATVDIMLCVFTYCEATEMGGALVVQVADVNVYGTSFMENTAQNGDDIFVSPLGNDNTIVIYSTCPSPYEDNTPTQGKFKQ